MRKTRVYDLVTCLCLRPLGGRQDVPLDSPAKLLRTTVLEKSSFNKLILPKQAGSSSGDAKAGINLLELAMMLGKESPSKMRRTPLAARK